MKYYIFTFGCVLNKADSERMKYLLEEAGLEEAEDPENADVIIINSCAVKTPAELKALRLIEKYKKEGKKVILAGCLTYNKEIYEKSISITPYSIDKIYQAIQEGKSFLEYRKLNKLKIGRKSSHPVVEIIPIQEGCPYGKCTYCAGKLARKIYQSFPIEDIVYWIERGLEEGKRIFYLSGMDVASYGFDLGLKLPDLLNEIAKIKSKFWIRLGMMNPFYLKLFLEDFLKIMKDDKLFKFFHIPVQSGSNKVLKEMKRPYTIEEFIELVEKIKKEFPRSTIATDIIVGYPTETEKDFYETLKLVRKMKFDVINISKYWPRPGTEAYKLKPLDGSIVKNRSRILSLFFDKYARERNKEWVGWVGKAIVEDYGRKKGSWIARNFAYKQIIINSKENLLGKEIVVEIKDYTHVDLRGEILEILD